MRRELEHERQRLAEHMQLLEEQMAAAKAQADRLDALERRLDAEAGSAGGAPDPVPGQFAAVEEEPIEQQDDDDDFVPERILTGPNETRDDHIVMTGNELAAEDFPGSWPMFGTDYRMKIGGYVRLDALYDFDGTGDEYQFLISQIPVEGSSEAPVSGYFNMFARETRFNIDVRDSSDSGTARQLFLEMDFFDQSSFSPRLRHAYFIYGNLLAGQTWTTIADLNSLPFTLDFGAGDALFGTRTPQIRWQSDINPNWSWAVGLEQLQYAGIYNPLDLPGRASSKKPVLAARLTQNRGDGVRSLAALAQELRWDSAGYGANPTATGWALIFAGRQNFGHRNFFTWNLAYGDGTPETIMALTGSDANAVLTQDYRLVTRKGYSAALGFGHRWSEQLTSNFAYAWTDLEDLGADQRAADAIQSGGIGHVNLIWAPARNLSTGIEYMWGRRENEDGAEGDANRVQGMIKYSY